MVSAPVCTSVVWKYSIRNLFILTSKIQMFKGMSAFNSELWLMVLQMQRSISSDVSDWSCTGFLLRVSCPWCHCGPSMAGRAGEQLQISLRFLQGFAACPEFLAALALEQSEFCWWFAGSTWGWMSKAQCVAAALTQPHLLSTCSCFLCYPSPAALPAPGFMQLHLGMELGTQLL